MTAIVGLVQAGRVYLGADSVSGDTGQWHNEMVRDPKVFCLGELAFGFTSSWRMGQLLRWKLTPPERDPASPVERWMQTSFVDAVRQLFNDAGFAKKDSNVETGGCFLVAVSGRLFTVNGDYHVAENVANYAAVGCGRDYALGALHATEGMNLTPEARIASALSAAANFSAYVRAPWQIVAAPSPES